MRINHEEYSKYINDLALLIKNKQLYSPILLNNETIVFHFVDNNKNCLVISLNHDNPLLYLIEKNDFYSSFENPQFLKLKKEILNTSIIDITLKNDDYIVAITLKKEDELLDKTIILYIELFPKKPNIILTTSDNIIINTFYADTKRKFINGEKYIYPTPIAYLENKNTLLPNFNNHYANELEIRKKEKYTSFNNHINRKIKAIKRKIDNINNDVEKANKALHLKDDADIILSENLNLKSHKDCLIIDGEKIQLDIKITILDNVTSMYKKAKKAKETILLSNKNIENAQKEIDAYNEILARFNPNDEFKADKIMQEIGMIKKKKEIKQTVFNTPYKINYNGTIIYFGKNASQNDYLSFVMKLDREFTWLHIKDKSGSHIVICNKKPTEKELLLAAEISLLCSRAISGEVIYTKKKNVRRGHSLGEAILKNYSVIRINNISKETKELYSKIVH